MADTDNLEGDDLIVHLLQQVAVRASVTLRALGTSRTDKTASRDITDAKRSIAGASVVKVSRLPGADELHRAIVAAQAEGKAALLSRSIPYGDNVGWRMLPNRHLIATMQDFGKARAKHDEAHREFIDRAPEILRRARENLGDFDIDLPTEAEIADAYSMKIDFEEIPSGRYEGLDESLTRKLAEHTRARTALAYRTGQAEVLPKLLGPVSDFAERMAAYTEREEKLLAGTSEDRGRTGQFRNAVVENLGPVVEAVRGFNFTSDARMETLAARIEALAGLDPGHLRSDPGLREKSRKEALAVVESIKDWT